MQLTTIQKDLKVVETSVQWKALEISGEDIFLHRVPWHYYFHNNNLRNNICFYVILWNEDLTSIP
jgi:hypothetical protein